MKAPSEEVKAVWGYSRRRSSASRRKPCAARGKLWLPIGRWRAGRLWITMPPTPINHHLAPHLREVCDSLRGHPAAAQPRCEDLAREAAQCRGSRRRSPTLHRPAAPSCEPQEKGESSMTRRSSTKAKQQGAVPPAPTIPKIPTTQVLPRLAALKTATAAELKDQWRALFGKEPPPFNRPYLVSRLSYRVQELAYGGLSRRIGRGSRRWVNSWTAEMSSCAGSALTAGQLPGTRLLREHDGVQQVVTVPRRRLRYTRGGRIDRYSAIARHIPGRGGMAGHSLGYASRAVAHEARRPPAR